MSSYRNLFLIPFLILFLIVATSIVSGCSSENGSKGQAENADRASVEEPATPPVDPTPEPIEPAEPDQPAEPVHTPEPEQPATPPESPEPDEPDEPDTPDAAPKIEEPGEPAPPAYDEPTIPPTPVKPADPPAPTVERSLGSVRVDAPKDGLTDVGVERCQKCHKTQYTSWLETEHAKLVPPLDCEACHGPGSEYRSLKVMKDPEASRAAGLVDPSPAFCTRCHVSGWDDEMMKRAHAHKSDSE